MARKHPGITALGPKRWRVRAWGVDPKTGKSREAQRLVNGPLPQALAEQAEMREAIVRGSEATRQRVTLATYAASWIERGRSKGRRRSTRVSQASILELHVKPWLGDYYVDAITVSDVETWLTDMAARTDNPRTDDGRYDPATIDLWLQKLRALVRAYYAEFGGASPLGSVERPRRASRAPRRENALTAEQAGALLEHVRATRPQWFALIYLGLTTGARIGELTALRWSDIDDAEGAILIRRAHVCGYEGDTKTGEPRALPLTGEMRDVLAWHRRRSLAEQRPGLGLGLVFPSKATIEAQRDHPGRLPLQRAHSVWKVLAKCAKELSMPRISPHGMRRTFNDLLRRSGTDGVLLRAMVGHRDEEMTSWYSVIRSGDGHREVSGLIRRMAGEPDSGPDREG